MIERLVRSKRKTLENDGFDTTIEIERKWSVRKKLLPDLSGCKSLKIEQGYFRDANKVWHRIRKETDSEGNVKFVETIKTKLGKKRSDGALEEHKELTTEEASIYWPLAEKIKIEKTRYYIPFGELMIELDFFGSSAEGLIMAEIEFTNKETSDFFTKEKWPEWFKKDITDRKGTSSKSVAMKFSKK